MKRKIKVISTAALAFVAGVLSLNVRADDLDAQKAFLVGQIENGANAQVKYEGLDAQKATLLAEIDGYVAEAKAAQAAHEALFEQQRINNIVADARNYAGYLQARIANFAETTRIKKEVVDNYTNLSKTDPQFAALLPAAIADYQKALNDQNYAQAVADSAKTFVNGPFVESNAKAALSWYAGPQDAGKFVMGSIGISTVY
ncbi:MAG: hypothetical protein K5770_01740 [Lachnospiraceae bacterium]|nr:hypothetical protein [Lachnospiraceae bacterium]